MNDSRTAASSRAEYTARINRVLDYIENNLERSLALEELARVACFSPYHFHRVFKALIGESLYQFILRLRLERAAQQLAYQPDKSVTAVALDCGFGSSATFARAFKAAFDMSASEWRAAFRKNCKTESKGCKDPRGAGGYLDLHAGAAVAADGDKPWRRLMTSEATQTRPVKAAQSVRVERLEPMTVAYVRHVGEYAGDAELFGRLFGQLCRWAGPRGLLGPGAKMLIVYHDNPDITDADKLRTSVCVTVPPDTKSEGEIGVMEIPGGQYAMAHFELDPSEYGAAWNWLMGTWLPESGFQPDDRPCFELCLGSPEDHPQGKHVVEICEPVRPL
ncbi:MAG: AraC family transcriptional regulator [Myxococcales bacterium]|jgi:AraC family transcriptional regulator